MNKEEFLIQLEQQLHNLPEEERKDILADYNEYFELGLLEGKPEQAIVESLGSPKALSEELMLTHTTTQAKDPTKNSSTISHIFSIAGLSIGLSFLFLFIIGPFLAMAGILLAGWTISLTFIGSPIIQLIGTLFRFAEAAAFEWFLSIALCGLGLMMLPAMYHLTRYFFRLIITYCKWNISLVKGGIQHV